MRLAFEGGIAPGVESLLDAAALRGRLAEALNLAAEAGKELVAADSPGAGPLASSWQVADAEATPVMEARIESGLMGRVALQGETAGEPFNIARAMEYGTPAHRIEPVNAAALAFQASTETVDEAARQIDAARFRNPAVPPEPEAEVVFALHVDHPGTPPHAMLRGNEGAISRGASALIREALEEGL